MCGKTHASPGARGGDKGAPGTSAGAGRSGGDGGSGARPARPGTTQRPPASASQRSWRAPLPSASDRAGASRAGIGRQRTGWCRVGPPGAQAPPSGEHPQWPGEDGAQDVRQLAVPLQLLQRRRRRPARRRGRGAAAHAARVQVTGEGAGRGQPGLRGKRGARGSERGRRPRVFSPRPSPGGSPGADKAGSREPQGSPPKASAPLPAGRGDGPARGPGGPLRPAA